VGILNSDPATGYQVRIILAAAALCFMPTPLWADALILRCDAKGEISFSVSIDTAGRSVQSMGFATKIETDQFSDTVIAASSKEVTPSQSLIIDRITGQFQLSWSSAHSGERGGSYQGSCAPARRLF
jgi:hypothetical protein